MGWRQDGHITDELQWTSSVTLAGGTIMLGRPVTLGLLFLKERNSLHEGVVSP